MLIDQLRRREITGPEFYGEWNGILASEMMSPARKRRRRRRASNAAVMTAALERRTIAPTPTKRPVSGTHPGFSRRPQHQRHLHGASTLERLLLSQEAWDGTV